MKIKSKDLFHGAVLTQIVEHPSFTALNKVNSKHGHYQINADRRLLLKRSSRLQNNYWHFTFNSDDIDTLVDDINSNQECFLCLICGKETICLLTIDEFEQLLDVSKNSQQWIKLEVPEGKSIRVKSVLCALNKKIPHSRFPDHLF